MSGRDATLLSPRMDNAAAGYSVEAVAAPEVLPDDARDFLVRAERENVEFGLNWYSNLCRTVFGADAGLRFYVLRDGGQVRAIFPLRAERALGGWKLFSLTNFYTTLYQPVLEPGLDAAALQPLLQAVRRDFPALGSMRLSPMDRASATYQTLLAALRLNGWLPYEFFCFGNWYHTAEPSWAEYLAGRSGSLRSTIKRMTKKFANDGGVLELVTEGPQLDEAIQAYEQVYATSWKRPEPFVEFMPGLIRMCSQQGQLRMGLAKLNGVAVAAQMWIVSHGRAEIYKVAYHEDYKQYSAGTLVTALLMEHVIDVDRVAEIDYLIGDDAYKRNWMGHRRERWGIMAYNPRTPRGLAGWAREVAGRVARKLLKRWRPAQPADAGKK